MTYSASSNGPTRPPHRNFRSFCLVLGVAGATVLGAAPGVAQASSVPDLSAAAACRQVSAASVSAIVGFSVPAATASADHLKPSKQNDGISATLTSCTYGSETSVAALAKTVGLSYEVTSRALTEADLKKGISEAQNLKINFVPYSGLGLSAFYYTFTEGGVLARGLTALNGKKEYGAFVYTKSVSTAKLAALVKLAEKL
jgi:hypothetical protein